MNFLDITIIIILGFSVIRGVFRGLIKELSSIIGVLGGFYAAYSYYMVLARPLSRWISNIISILGVVIKYVLNIAFLGWVDRICGAGFGITKGILIASVLLITLTAFLPKNAPVIKDSMLAPHVTLVSEKMAKVVSKDMKHKFTAKLAELKKAWKKMK